MFPKSLRHFDGMKKSDKLLKPSTHLQAMLEELKVFPKVSSHYRQVI